MNAADRCTTCGARLLPGAPGNRCVRCLLESALAVNLARDELPGAGLDSMIGPTPDRVGDYRVLEEIGRGGMGIVCKARQLSLDRVVALKRLLPGAQATPESLHRFRVEAEAAASLRHPNLVAIHDFGEHLGQPYFAMEYVAGPNLAEVTRDRPLPPGQAARYVQRIAGAVHYAHQHGVLHRDLKPSNILIDPDDQPRITDFGLAKRGVGDSDVTLTGQALGSPNYMPPEQAAGQPGRFGRAGDIYALGAVLYHLLTGRPPFVAETPTATLRQVLETEPIAPRLLNASVPRDLDTLCLKCLEKEPTRRFGTAQDLADELGRFLAGEPIRTRPVGPVGRLGRWCRRKPQLAGVIGGALLIVLAVSGVALERIAAARQQEKVEQYAANIALADRYIKDGSIDRARDLLLKCPPELRHWEWGHLLYLCHEDILSLPAHTNRPRERFFGGTQLLVGMAFDATGRRLATHGYDGSLKVWELSEGRLELALGDATDRVTAWAWHPGGEELAVATTNGSVRLFDARLWRTVRTWAIDPGGGDVGSVKSAPRAVSGLAYEPGGHRLVMTMADREAVVWERKTGRTLLVLTNLGTAIEPVRFTADAHHLIVKEPLAVRLLDPETGREVSGFKADRNTTWELFVDPTGRRFATSEVGQRVRLWDEAGQTRSLGILRAAHPGGGRVLFSPDGSLAFVCGHEGAARLYRTATGEELLNLAERTWSIAFTASGDRFVALGASRLDQVWDVELRKKVVTRHGRLTPGAVAAFSPDGLLLATAGDDGVVRLWTARPGRERFEVGAWCGAAAYSPDGRSLTLAPWWGNTTVWDAEGGQPLFKLKSRLHQPITAAYSPDGREIVTVGVEKSARIWNASTGALIGFLRSHQRTLSFVAYSPDGKWIATTDMEGTVKVWEARSRREAYALPGRGYPVFHLQFDRAGQRLATTDIHGPLRVWDVASGELRIVLNESSSGTAAVAFSSEGSQIAAVAGDGVLRIWEASTGRLLRSWRCRSTGSLGLAFSPDGRRLVVPVSDNVGYGSDPGGFEIWDVVNGRQLLTLTTHSEPPTSVLFSPDGRRLFTTAADFAGQQHESFPWEEDAYSALPGATLPERVQGYARRYWRKRIAKEAASLLGAPTRATVRDADADLYAPRDPALGPEQLDLKAFYTGLLDVLFFPTGGNDTDDLDDLAELPTGAVTFGGVRFDVRGLIMLCLDNSDGAVGQALWRSLPEQVKVIPVGRRVRRVQLLQGAVHSGVVDGTPIARLIWHYADGSQRETDIVYGRDVRDWWQGGTRGDPETESERGRVAWTGTNPVATKYGSTLRLYVTAYANPRPEAEVSSIDLVSTMARTGLFVVAITVEP